MKSNRQVATAGGPGLPFFGVAMAGTDPRWRQIAAMTEVFHKSSQANKVAGLAPDVTEREPLTVSRNVCRPLCSGGPLEESSPPQALGARDLVATPSSHAKK